MSQVDISMRDQVWLRLECGPGVLFGFCYVPPIDSPYFDCTLLSNIHTKVKMRRYGVSCMIVGDLNARFGHSFCELPVCLEQSQCSYRSIPDPLRTPNENA